MSTIQPVNNPVEILQQIQGELLNKLKIALQSKECDLQTMKLAAQVLKDNNIVLPPPKAGDPTEILEVIEASVGEIEYKKKGKEEEENIGEFKAIEL